jgi:hypothetical protein
MEREKQIERMEGAENRASAFLARVLSSARVKAILARGNPQRPAAAQNEERERASA